MPPTMAPGFAPLTFAENNRNQECNRDLRYLVYDLHNRSSLQSDVRVHNLGTPVLHFRDQGSPEDTI